MALVRIKDRAQITLPPEVRKALNVGVGDYLETELVEGGILLKPVEVVDRSPARVALAKFLAGRTWKGEGDEPSEAETMKAVLKEIRALRRSNESGSR